jgi:hypothetical protein
MFKCEMFRLKEPIDPVRNKKLYHQRILRKQQSVLADYHDIVDLDIDSVTLKEAKDRNSNRNIGK